MTGLLGLVCSLVYAGATLVPEFTGDWTEDFESATVVDQGGEQCIALAGGEVCSTNMITNISWSFTGGCTIGAYEGSWFAGSGHGPAVYTLDEPTTHFGGRFGTSYPDAPNTARFTFWDEGGGLVDQVDISTGDCASWAWLGWEFSTAVQTIQVELLESTTADGAYVMMDDIRVGPGGPDFAISAPSGCPGEVTVNVSGVAPTSTYYLMHARWEGSTTIPVGPCAGVEVPLSLPKWVAFTADAAGSDTHNWSATDHWCPRRMAVLDPSTCTVSNVAGVVP